MDCIFCKIINKEIPSEAVYEDDKVYAFKDIQPQAPVHILIVPKMHIPSANYINVENINFIAEILLLIPKIAKELGIETSGYRLITNHGNDGCQTVDHLHFHLIGGKKLSESLS